ncbi:MAG: basic amino acid ABC transporter substrate-binding protein [Nitrospinae bacterium]|nr:basic amino acid ABC transporter substrate-binding protein [Nitrospinota bacterium]
MTLKRRIAWSSLLALMLFLCGCGEETKKLVIATDTTLIPMSFIGDDRKIVGFEPDLIHEVAKIAGFDYEMVNVEWTGLFGGLITRKYDAVVASVTILEERKKRMAFSIPYLRSGLALVVRRDQEGVNSIADIKAKNLLIGAQMGTTAYFYLEKDPALRKKGYQVYGHAVTDLINGKVDAVLGESTGTLYYKNQKKEYFQKIRMVGEILTEEYYGIVLRKDNTELLEKINHALKQLLKNGAIVRLHKKWDLGEAAQVPVAE